VLVIVVNVMDDLGRLEKSSDGRFHHQSVLAHIACGVCVRMLRTLHQHVAVLIDCPAALPVSMLRSRLRASVLHREAMTMTEAAHLLRLDWEPEALLNLWTRQALFCEMADLDKERH